MGKFDLNKATDFARAVSTPGSAILTSLLGLNPNEWDIVECTFISNMTLKKSPNAKPLRLLVLETAEPFSAGMSQISDTGGRRKVKFQYPYRDGQTTDDLGKKPETFHVNVLFHGPEYMQALERLLREANQPSPGVFRHPVRGEQTVALEDYELVHSHDARKAVAVRLSFIEHTFTIDKLDKSSPKANSSIKTALLAALEAIKKIDKVITKVQATVIATQQFRQQAAALASLFKADYTLNLQKMNATFNAGTSVDLPGLLPVQGGGNPNGNTMAMLLAPDDPFKGVSISTDTSLITAVSAQQAVNDNNDLRAKATTLIATLSEAEDGQGALVFHDEIVGIKESAIAMQDVLETGLESSRFSVVSYSTPRLMSVREVAFAVGLSVQKSYEIELLNPSILSMNFIEKGTVLQVPQQ